MTNELPELGYAYNSLEPYIDEATMILHHDKHHATYVKKLNEALEAHPELKDKPVQELIKSLNSLPADVKTAVRNHGGGHLNHSFFWTLLKKDTKPSGKLASEIKKDFGGIEQFQEQFKKAALGQFGSGWAWLVFNPSSKKLEIVSTPNQDSPLTDGKIPILTVDVWEHAYYLKYQNKRDEYLDNFFHVVNWKKADENFSRAR